MHLTEPRDVESLIVNLGLTFGYCLSPGDASQLQRLSFDDPDAFLDAFLRIYGLDPARVERRRMHEMVNVIRDLW